MGFGRVQTGANVCGWVRMGALGRRGHREHKIKAKGGHLWSHRSGFRTYGRGNFLRHDVLWLLPKMVKNECRWTIVNEDGCDGTCEHEGTRNNTKIYTNGRVRQHLVTHGHGKKISLTLGLSKNQTASIISITLGR